MKVCIGVRVPHEESLALRLQTSASSRISDIRWHKMLRDARVTGSGKLRRGTVVVSTGRKGPISPVDGSFSGEAAAAPANVGFVPKAVIRT